MDPPHLSLRSKSTSTLKPKPPLIKQLQKIAKQASTPTARRDLLKKITVPSTTKAIHTGKSYETLAQRSKQSTPKSNASVKPSPVKSSPKTTTGSSSQKHLKKKSLQSPLILKRPSTISKTSPQHRSSPKSSSAPRSLSGATKSLIPAQKEKLNRTSKIISSIIAKTCTGSINGKLKSNNQDDFFLHNNYAQCTDQTLMGVMDGHGIYGHDVSAFVKRQLPLMIENNLPYEGITYIVTSTTACSPEILSKIRKAFTQGFLNCHKALVSKRIIDINYSGTTAITVLIREKFIICANVGDSRAVIGRFNEIWYPVDLSIDHKPNDKGERMRIEEAGGRVEPFKEPTGQFVGPDRVWLQHEQLPGLAMSRSIGDLVAAHVGVISEPDIIIHELTELDKFLIIATDGIWEFISSQDCVKIISEFYSDLNIEKACDKLMQRAIHHWQVEDNVIDDITFILVFLNVS